MTYELTHHAAARTQQRGLPKYIIEYLTSYGSEVHVVGGCIKYIFDGAATQRFEKALGSDALMDQLIEKLRKAFVILSGDGAIVTAGWCCKPTRKKWNSWGKARRHEIARRQGQVKSSR